MRDFKELKVWQKAHKWVIEVYLQPEVHRQLDDQVNEVKRMLNSFIRALG